MNENFPEANINNIERVVGNWLIHSKYKKRARISGADSQNPDDSLNPEGQAAEDNDLNVENSDRVS